jgi:U3 small nucleolar ribonucleoprotein protein IMP4
MSVRRNSRLRREYLYKKSLHGEQSVAFARKEAVRRALETGTPLPTELRKDAEGLKKAIDLEDDVTAAPRSSLDDEYATAGVLDPKVCVTTSRDPSSRLKQFAAEVRLIFPNAQRINRGNTTIREVVAAARDAEFTDFIVVAETRGEPDGLIISHLPYGPTVHFSLSNTVMRHDIEGRAPVSEVYPHLVFSNFSTGPGLRIRTVLQHLFPVPKEESKRIVTFSNDSDYVSFRHHMYTAAAGAGGGGGKMRPGDVALAEVGPRFDMKPYAIKLGTVDQKDADAEWQLRSYINTARKNQVL